MNDVQERVNAFVYLNGLTGDVHNVILDLASEVGELCKEYNKISQYGKKPFTVSENFELEMGDILFSLILVARNSGTDLENALDKTLSKFEDRMRANGEIGSGK